MELPENIPLFPLPNVVLFPDVDLPLHIFEPRYREMVAEAMAADRLIGMVLLRADRTTPEGSPPSIYRDGCVGRISEFEELPDGRSNLILHGERSFEIVDEVPGRAYRRARVRWRERVPGLPESDVQDTLKSRVLALLERSGTPSPEAIWEKLPEDWDHLVNLLSFGLPLKEVEKMSLLQCDGAVARAQKMIEILDFQLAELDLGSGGASGSGESWH